MRVQRRFGENDLRHFEPVVAEQRHRVHDDRYAVRGNDRIAFERPRAHDGQSFQVERRAREMAQQADVEFFEIDPCVEHLIGFALHDLGDLPLSNIGATKAATRTTATTMATIFTIFFISYLF